MNETAKHETLEADPSVGIVKRLAELDLTSLSFIQLRRLQNALEQGAIAVDKESQRRSSEGNSGDTVRIPSPQK